MNEPVAYLVSQEPLSSVRWLSDVKPMGIDDKQITPLYTEDRLKNKIELTATEFELLAKVCRGIQPFQKIEQNIKIVHNMKWFVRSKEEDEDYHYLFLSGSNLDDLGYFEFDYARAFDTKEEAELWVNPLTEAVQLPVEED